MKKFRLASVLAPAFLMVGLTFAIAPVMLAQDDQITIKDPAEFSAYQNAITQTDPKAKASQIESFLQAYPQSVVKNSVLLALLGAYTDPKYAPTDLTKILDASQRVLQVDPNNLGAMYYIVLIKKQQAAQQAASNPAQQAQLLDDAAAVSQKGLAATKPAAVSDADFKKQKTATDALFQSVIAYDDIYSKKDLKAAIAEFRAELEETAAVSPDATKSGQALNDTLVLGQTYTQLTPPDMVNGVYFLARAEDFAPDNFKPVIDKQAKYWYRRYHGKDDGFDDVKTAAATSVFPSPDFAIKPADTPADVANKVVTDTTDYTSLALSDKEFILANASHDNAEKVWAVMKGQVSQVPGIVIASTASQIQVAVTEDAKTDKKADFTVNMKTPLADADIPAVGSDVENLIGTFDSYTQDPPQIIMSDGEIQAPEKKKPVAHKPAAGHHAAH